MKPDKKEAELQKAAALRSGEPKPGPPSAPPTPPGTHTPPQFPLVFVTREPKSQQDILATKLLLDRYQTEDGYKCPRCPFITTSVDDFTDHLADEINNSITQLAKNADQAIKQQ